MKLKFCLLQIVTFILIVSQSINAQEATLFTFLEDDTEDVENTYLKGYNVEEVSYVKINREAFKYDTLNIFVNDTTEFVLVLKDTANKSLVHYFLEYEFIGRSIPVYISAFDGFERFRFNIQYKGNQYRLEHYNNKHVFYWFSKGKQNNYGIEDSVRNKNKSKPKDIFFIETSSTNSIFEITVNAEKECNDAFLKLYDNLGNERQVFFKNKSLESGTYNFTLDGSRLNSGMFTLVLKLDDKIISKRVINVR